MLMFSNHNSNKEFENTENREGKIETSTSNSYYVCCNCILACFAVLFLILVYLTHFSLSFIILIFPLLVRARIRALLAVTASQGLHRQEVH